MLADFNPRAPCGARQTVRLWAEEDEIFQSTRPLRGATCKCDSWLLISEISIHAPLAGRDL